MKIISLVIDSYKKFHPTIKIDFNKDINLLIGINGSGKSSIFEALAIIFSDVKKYCDDGKLREKRFNFKVEYSYINRKVIEETSNTQEELVSIDLITLSNSGESGLPYTMTINGEIANNRSEILAHLPDNLIFYYAGFCETLKNIVHESESKQAERLLQIRSDKQYDNIPKLLSKQIIYIKRKHFPLLFLLNFIGQNTFSLPQEKSNFRFQRISLVLRKPSNFKSNKYDDFYGLSGFLRKYLDNLLHYSSPITLDEDLKSPVLYIDFDLGFISALEDMGNWVDQYYQHDNTYLLFQIFNLLFEIELVEKIVIAIKKDDDEIPMVIDIEDLSEGEQQMITISAIKRVLCKDNSVLILDEPDAFLHPKRQRDLIPHLTEIFTESHNQIILASHSPFVAQSIDFNNIILFGADGKIKKVENQVLDFKAVNDVLFDVDERFNEVIESKLNQFKLIRDKIMLNEKINKAELKSLVKEIEGYGEETAIIISRELSQLERLKKFNWDE